MMVRSQTNTTHLFEAPDMNGSGQGEDDDSVEFLGVSVPGQGWDY